jgi:hypothetical protein
MFDYIHFDSLGSPGTYTSVPKEYGDFIENKVLAYREKDGLYMTGQVLADTLYYMIFKHKMEESATFTL